MFAHVWEELICETAEVLAAAWYLCLQPGSELVDCETFSYGNGMLGAKKWRFSLL